MKLQIVSDLHVDINETFDFGFINKNDCDLTIIAGDIAGSSIKEKKFLKTLNEETIVIGGNHLGYDYQKIRQYNSLFGIDNPKQETKQDCIAYLQTSLPNNIHYLNNEYIKFKDKIIFGGTMYTNFELYGRQNKKLCKNIAERWMNDFRNVYIIDKKLVRPVTADDYNKWFKLFMKKLKQCISETTEDIIVVSHFAPSRKSISKYYGHQGRSTYYQPGKELNAAYVANLEKFIKENKRIKLWIHGHMHDQFDYYIEQCHVVCYPYGYKHDTTLLPSEYQGIILDI